MRYIYHIFNNTMQLPFLNKPIEHATILIVVHAISLRCWVNMGPGII